MAAASPRLVSAYYLSRVFCRTLPPLRRIDLRLEQRRDLVDLALGDEPERDEDHVPRLREGHHAVDLVDDPGLVGGRVDLCVSFSWSPRGIASLKGQYTPLALSSAARRSTSGVGGGVDGVRSDAGRVDRALVHLRGAA